MEDMLAGIYESSILSQRFFSHKHHTDIKHEDLPEYTVGRWSVYGNTLNHQHTQVKYYSSCLDLLKVEWTPNRSIVFF